MAWLEKLTSNLGERDPDKPYLPTLHCDNQGAINLMRDAKFHSKAKHIDIRMLFIRNDMVANKRLQISHTAGSENPADLLTKQLPLDAWQKHSNALGMDEL